MKLQRQSSFLYCCCRATNPLPLCTLRAHHEVYCTCTVWKHERLRNSSERFVEIAPRTNNHSVKQSTRSSSSTAFSCQGARLHRRPLRRWRTRFASQMCRRSSRQRRTHSRSFIRTKRGSKRPDIALWMLSEGRVTFCTGRQRKQQTCARCRAA